MLVYASELDEAKPVNTGMTTKIVGEKQLLLVTHQLVSGPVMGVWIRIGKRPLNCICENSVVNS
jgi:hypothetical protein